MRLVKVLEPAAEPVSLTEAKAHLRIDATDDDNYIPVMIQAARNWAEQFTRRQFIAATYRLDMDTAPSGEIIDIPRPPMLGVSSITYTDPAGATQTMSSSDYTADTGHVPGRVLLGYADTWPVPLDDYNVFSVTFYAGYSTPFTADADTDVVTFSGRNPVTGEVFQLWNTGGALPTGLSTLTNYYVKDVSGATCKLALTSGGTAINVTGAGAGTHFAGLMPAAIRQAILQMTSDMYENRMSINVGNIVNELPFAVKALLWPYRMMENL